MIDWTQLETPEARAAAQQAHRQAVARAECQRRLLAVASEATQINMAAAAAAGLLPKDQMTTYRAWVEWVAAMRVQAAVLADKALDPTDDACWPECPPEAIALARAF